MIQRHRYVLWDAISRYIYIALQGGAIMHGCTNDDHVMITCCNDGPLQCIVSDMTAFYVKGIYYELTLYMDLWNNEILSHSLSAKRGDRMTYISGLQDLLELKKQHPEIPYWYWKRQEDFA